MLKQLQLISLLSFTGILYAQEFDWAAQFSGTNAGQGIAVTSDMEGNVVTTGVFQGTVDFDPGAGTSEFIASSQDIYITKQDENGELLWAKQIGSIGTEIAWGIATNSTNDIFLTGSFQGTVDFDPDAGDFSVTAVGAQDIFVLKLSSDGEFEWLRTMGSADSENGDKIRIDDSDNIIVTGLINNGTVDMNSGAGTFNLTGNYDSFILKLNSSGDFVWAKLFENLTDIVSIYDCTLDNSGNIYTTGFFVATANFNTSGGTDNLTAVGSRDIFVCKLNNSGDLEWVKQMGGADSDFGFSVDLDAAGNLFVSGTFSSTADFDPGPGSAELVSAGGRDIFVCKLDPSGNYVWVNGVGGTGYDEANSIRVNAHGLVYFAGAFSETVDFDPGAGTANLTSAGSSDGVLVKLQADGSFISAESIGGTEGDWVHDLDLDPSGHLLLTGWFSGAADLNPSAGIETYTATGANDPFVIRMELNDVGIFDGMSKNEHVGLYPNPARETLSIQSDEAIENSAIYNLSGELMQVENTSTFTVENLPVGVYFLHVKTRDNVSIIRFIKQ